MDRPARDRLDLVHESQTNKGLSLPDTSKHSQGGQSSGADRLEEIDN